MISTLVKPRRRATSTSSYWRLWLSRFDLNLLRRRLADIDDRLALQHGCRKERVMRGHRRPPASRRRLPPAGDAPET